MVMAREHAMQRLWVANAYFSIRYQAAELLRTEFLRSTALRPKFDACQRKLAVSTNAGERRAGSGISGFILRCDSVPVLDGR